jgi:hypothetical protein
MLAASFHMRHPAATVFMLQPEGARNESFRDRDRRPGGTVDSDGFRTPLQPLFSCPPALGYSARPRPPRPTRTPLLHPRAPLAGRELLGLVPLPVHGASTPVPLVIGFAQHDLTCPAPWASHAPSTKAPHNSRAYNYTPIRSPPPPPSLSPSCVCTTTSIHHCPPNSRNFARLFNSVCSKSPFRSRTIDHHSARRRLCSPPETALDAAPKERKASEGSRHRRQHTAPQSIDDDNPATQHRGQFTNFPRSVKSCRQNPPSVQS